jgi:dCTP deaminase
MILTGQEISHQVKGERIRIEGFDPDRVTTNSYDLRLGDELIRYTCEVLDPKVDNPTETVHFPAEGVSLERGEFLLGRTQEAFGSDYYVPKIHAKSSTARLGLFVHITADLIDVGAYGCATLQLFATLPVRIYPGMSIAQVTFWRPDGEITLYHGKYQGARKPMASMQWKSKGQR